ncbi:MAG: DDE-type integrase/transposase/recombinase [Thermoplasmatales archaeon]|nr:DDE-type integrase/transposase/recombinase [Thermoplasmatales archaeon]
MKETIEKWCKKEGIEVEYTPPYYPQTKGKIERAIRTFNEEFLKMFFYYFRNLLNGLTIIDTTWVSMIILPMYIFQKMLPMLLDNTQQKLI